MLNPHNAIAAVTHPNPYPYYAALVADKPIYYDESLHLWIAASAKAVSEILTSDLCRVRPASEPIPRNLVGSSAGYIFAALVRMTDGDGHCPLKKAVSATLDTLDPAVVYETGLRHAKTLAADCIPDHVSDFAFSLPAYTVAELLGVPSQYLSSVAVWMADFVRCLSPISTSEQIKQGKQAADLLLNLFHRLLIEQQAKKNPTLLVLLSQILSQMAVSDSTLVLSNSIGFISQTYEATAGLIGNALIALAAQPDLQQELAADFNLMERFVDEVARFDSPVQNTRRFIVEDGMAAGQPMKAGDVILVLLAAANRDPAANSQPDQFDLYRQNSICFTFGSGIHACPGQSLAGIITQAALMDIIGSGLDAAALAKISAYRPSVNTRIPLFN